MIASTYSEGGQKVKIFAVVIDELLSVAKKPSKPTSFHQMCNLISLQTHNNKHADSVKCLARA